MADRQGCIELKGTELTFILHINTTNMEHVLIMNASKN